MFGEKEIIVLGDWFIDENWIVTEHSSYASSFVGDIHYLSEYDKIDRSIISLCGACEIFEILRSHFYKNHNHKRFGVWSQKGFGIWSHKDNNILQCALCNKHPESKYLTPGTLFSLKEPEVRNGKRMCPYTNFEKKCTYNYNENNNYNAKLINIGIKNGNKNLKTNRIFRFFKETSTDKFDLLYRVDWEDKIELDIIDLTSLNEIRQNVDVAVVIEDHGRGVVTDEVIEQLNTNLEGEKVRWYIRSTKEDPTWMKKIDELGISVRLKMISETVASRKEGEIKWRFGKTLGPATLTLFDKLSNKEERIVILFDDNTVIAKDNTINDEEKNCYNLYKPPGKKLPINIGWDTLFFTSLIAQDIDNNIKKTFREQCQEAIEVAYHWSEKANKGIGDKENFFFGDYHEALKPLNVTNKADIIKIREDNAKADVNHKSLTEEWGKVKEDIGVIDKVLQIWRGMEVLDNYICIGDDKREAINDLLRKISFFNKNKENPYSLNILLTSSPGWGKTRLAKTIAEKYNMEFREFSLSQMAKTDDLVDCFDIIHTTQNRLEKDKKVLIFMDEVNCHIEGYSAMGLLLSPIMDGNFVKNGRMYNLSPAVWIFASTGPAAELAGVYEKSEPKSPSKSKPKSPSKSKPKSPSKSKPKSPPKSEPESPPTDKDKINKGSDFLSRLNGPIIELDKLGTEKVAKEKAENKINLLKTINKIKRHVVIDSESAKKKIREIYNGEYYKIIAPFKTEQVYLGALFMTRQWGEKLYIQRKVLELFRDMLLVNGVRSMEFFVSKFRDIERGRVYCSNVPFLKDFKELERHVVLPNEWNDEEERLKGECLKDKCPKNENRDKSKDKDYDLIEIEIEVPD